MTAIGAMRLSTDIARDDERAFAVLCAAIDAGVTVIDTADAYALDDGDVGHNERLIARARAARPGVKLVVVTKGGLTRPGGRWVPDGRAKHLADAARASAAALGAVPDVYLLHAMDPRTPLATSVRALSRLRERGVVSAIGVSNVDRTRLEAALAIAEIAVVEVELSPFVVDAVRGGLLELCAERGIAVLAHRPLGGASGAARLARDSIVATHAARLGATPAELGLAWLRTLSPVVVPIPGVTRIETARSAGLVAAIDDDAKSALDDRFLALVAKASFGISAPTAGDEVVVILGVPGAGKSTLAARYVAQGYLRLNRDDRGGKLDNLARALDDALASGHRRVVLDNTYTSRSSRAPVIAAARRHGVAVRCEVLDTSNEDAQVNAVARMLERYGKLLDPNELRRASRDGGTFAPGAQFRWRRDHEPPRVDEGFATVDTIRFVRTSGGGTHSGVIVDLDDVVWRGRPTSSSAVELLPGAIDAIDAWNREGRVVVATTWQPAIAESRMTDASMAEVIATLRARVPAIRAVAYCPHPAGPPICWCRKPLPGMGLVLARDHDLDLTHSIHAGRSAADRGFASRLGMTFVTIAS